MQPENENWQRPTPQSTDAPFQAPPADDEVATESTAVSEATAQEDVATQTEKPAAIGQDQIVRWRASEYIYREKDPRWYMAFAAVVIGFMVLSIFAFKSITFSILIPVMAAALVVYSRRPPTLLDYTLSRKGLHIDDKLYPYEQFKEFGLIHGDDQFSIMLVPRERFKPGVTVYFPEEAGEAVVDMLAARLPMHDVELDPIDRFIRMLKI